MLKLHNEGKDHVLIESGKERPSTGFWNMTIRASAVTPKN
jgi:hypothetical protein